MTHRFLLPLLLAFAAFARAEDTSAAVELREALDRYDGRAPGEFVDTIPVEKAVLRAGEEDRVEDLLAAAAHPRFGSLAFTVLCESTKRPAEARVVAAFQEFPTERRIAAAPALAALRTESVRAALRALAATEDVAGDEAASARVRAALVRAGDAAAIRDVRGGLASKDRAAAAAALLLAGDARSPREFLADAARLAADARKLECPTTSRFTTQRKETTPDGGTTVTTAPVDLVTVGDVAVEAANRMCASPLPEDVAWWYEPEKGPRFGSGEAGARLLVAAAAADEKAAKSKALRFDDACRAVLGAVRRSGEFAELRLTTAAFDAGTWTFDLVLSGRAGRAAVGPDGKASLR